MANEFVVKNGLHIPAGLLATPSLAFASDTDTGIYLSGANTFNLVSGTASRISVGDAVGVTPRPNNNFTVTTAGSGQITLTSADAFNISGAAASSIYTTNADILVYTGTGRLYLGDDATANTCRFGAGAGVKTVTVGSTNTTSITTVQSGTGGTSVTSTGAFTITGAVASSIYTTNVNLTIYSGTGRLYIGDDATAQPLRFGTGAGVKNVTVGSIDTTSITTVQSGTSGTVITSTGSFSISSSGAAITNYIYTTNTDLVIYSGTGRIYISDDVAATILRFGAGNAAKTVTVGSTNTTSSTTIQSGTGDILISSRDAFNIVGYGDSGTLSSIYTVNVGLSIYSGTGTINFSADATSNSINIATGAGVKALTLGSTNTTSGITIQSGGNGITITSPGNVSLTSSTYAGVPAKVAMTTDVGGWIKNNDTYFVPSGGTGLQNLLQAIIATTVDPGVIILEDGTHTINWTAATIVNQPVTIIGNNATINFTDTDADCYLYFSSRCVLQNLKFTGPAAGWLAPCMVRVSGAFSSVTSCRFDGAPVGAGTSYLLYVDAAGIVVDQCSFVPNVIAGAAVVDDSLYFSANSYRSKVTNSYFNCDYCQVGAIILVASTTDVVMDSCNFYCANILGLARITFEAGTANCILSKCNWNITAASTGRVLTFAASDTGGTHLITHNNIYEAASATNTRPSCIYVAQPHCRFDSNTITTANRIHGGAPDANRDRAAIYILAHHCSVIGNMFDLGGSAQEGIVVLNTGNVAANVAMEGVFISNNYIYGIDGVTATGGYGIWVNSTAGQRPIGGVIDTNKFQATANNSWNAGATAVAGSGPISWTIVGNGRRLTTAMTQGDWVTGGIPMIANNQ